MAAERRYRAGDTIEDICRACKVDRLHTVIVVDGDGRPLRVTCDYCHSEHNYRGGPAMGRPAPGQPPRPHSRSTPGSALPIVSDREPRASDPVRLSRGGHEGPPLQGPSMSTRGADAAGPASSPFTAPASAPAESIRSTALTGVTDILSRHMASDSIDDFEVLLRRIIREEAGVTPLVPAQKWRGGTLVLRPAQAGLQEKTWPIDTLFHKIVMIRNRLRTLEQQINASELPEDVKLKLQAYVSGCYGSLTSFNLLFADEQDQFKGSGGE